MSVEFIAEMGEVSSFEITCLCGTATRTVITDTYSDACSILARVRAGEHDLGCDSDTCWGDGERIELHHPTEDSPSVQLSCSNAARVLNALGYGDNEKPVSEANGTFADAFQAMADMYSCGTATAEEFTGRVLIAEATYPSNDGAAAESITLHGGGTVVAPERRDTYMTEVLAHLHKVAEYAQAHHANVTWG